MSKGEKLLAEILNAEFPFYHIEPQYPIKVGYAKRTTLYLDFYIPKMRLAFEVDGRQHSQYVGFFHGDRHGYDDSKHRDRLKQEWCDDNNVRLIRLTDVSKNELRKQLQQIAQEEN